MEDFVDIMHGWMRATLITQAAGYLGNYH